MFYRRHHRIRGRLFGLFLIDLLQDALLELHDATKQVSNLPIGERRGELLKQYEQFDGQDQFVMTNSVVSANILGRYADRMTDLTIPLFQREAKCLLPDAIHVEEPVVRRRLRASRRLQGEEIIVSVEEASVVGNESAVPSTAGSEQEIKEPIVVDEPTDTEENPPEETTPPEIETNDVLKNERNPANGEPLQIVVNSTEAIPQIQTEEVSQVQTDEVSQTQIEEIPRSQTEEVPQTQTEKVSQSQTEVPQSQTEEVPQSQTEEVSQTETEEVPQTQTDEPEKYSDGEDAKRDPIEGEHCQKLTFSAKDTMAEINENMDEFVVDIPSTVDSFLVACFRTCTAGNCVKAMEGLDSVKIATGSIEIEVDGMPVIGSREIDSCHFLEGDSGMLWKTKHEKFRVRFRVREERGAIMLFSVLSL